MKLRTVHLRRRKTLTYCGKRISKNMYALWSWTVFVKHSGRFKGFRRCKSCLRAGRIAFKRRK